MNKKTTNLYWQNFRKNKIILEEEKLKEEAYRIELEYKNQLFYLDRIGQELSKNFNVFYKIAFKKYRKGVEELTSIVNNYIPLETDRIKVITSFKAMK